MQQPIQYLALAAVVGTGLIGCGKKGGHISDPDIARFVVAKRAQARELADAQTNAVPSTVWKFFDAVERDDWQTATNLFAALKAGRGYSPSSRPSPLSSTLKLAAQKLGVSQSPSPALLTELWSPIVETLGTYEAVQEWDQKWMRRFGRDIIDSIPTNSIYFGGNDAGRFLISALSESHREGRPFFTLTQNGLADGTYLDYLRGMYGHALYIPTQTDSQQAFQEYLTDAQQRLKEKKLKPGEDVRIVENRVQVSGHIAVMQINGLLAKIIVDKNPTREIYVEESFPLDWMYPFLSPHGLIMKLNREPQAELSESAVSQDHAYWNKYVQELIGDWINDATPVAEVCEFGERVYLRKELAGFKGDTGFARNEAAQKTFSKLRSSIGGVYAWRAERAATEAGKQRMTQEADFAFRQALALYPRSSEAVYRYVSLLVAQGRKTDARLVARTYLRMSPTDTQAKGLVESLERAD